MNGIWCIHWWCLSVQAVLHFSAHQFHFGRPIWLKQPLKHIESCFVLGSDSFLRKERQSFPMSDFFLMLNCILHYRVVENISGQGNNDLSQWKSERKFPARFVWWTVPGSATFHFCLFLLLQDGLSSIKHSLQLFLSFFVEADKVCALIWWCQSKEPVGCKTSQLMPMCCSKLNCSIIISKDTRKTSREGNRKLFSSSHFARFILSVYGRQNGSCGSLRSWWIALEVEARANHMDPLLICM